MNEAGNQDEHLFHAARQLTDTRQRAGFLDAACGGDADLRRRLDELFEAQPEAEAFFETPAAGARPASAAATPNMSTGVADVAVRAPTDEDAGTMIGRYKLLQKIGNGGFGAVYMAEQKEPVKRRVALKIIKLGMDTRQVVARFEAERQALALMEHPNIAKVFDAGATESGRPFFVMELVRGTPITQYCDENNLPPAARLELFMQVCRAIQHAHQKGIIHRDIKPTNILVTLHDGAPVPKVIDFGIAKATQQELTEKSLFTQFHQFIGTPAYMSPEQAERSGVDIDTRSDIYSLGVLLYELLTGKTPFNGKELLAAGLDEMRKTIREKEPVRPSTRLTHELVAATRQSAANLGKELSGALPSRRHGQIRELIHLLRGDLDWIVMKALEKDRRRRYETANGLAIDIERHLHNEPVEARPPSQLYRLQKFAQRNKLQFAAVIAIAIVLLLGVFVSARQAIRATKAEQRTRRTAYFAEMNSAGHALAEGNLGRVRELLAHHLPTAGQPDLRGWEWRYLANLTRGEQGQRLVGHTGGVSGLCFLDDNQLLSVGWDRRAIWWDVALGRETHTLTISSFTMGLAVAPGHRLAALAGNHPSAEVGDVTLLDLDGRSERATSLPRPNADNTLFDFSPSGELAMADAADAGPLALWDANAGKRLAVFENKKDEYNFLRFSPEGHQLAAATREGWIQMWDVASRSNFFSWPAHARAGGFRTTVNTLAFSPNGRQLVSAGVDGSATVWNSATGARLAPLEGHHAPVIEVAYSPNGDWLAAASLDHALYVWETASWRLVKILRGHSEEVRRVAWSPNGHRLASGGPNGELLLWDWPPRTNSTDRIEFSAMLDLNLSETGDTLLRHGSGTNPVVEFWDTKSLHLTAQYPTPDTNIVSGWLLPGGRLIATGDHDGRVGIWEPASGRELTGSNAHESTIYGITGSADGRVIVTLSLDGEALVWDLPALTLRLQFHTGRPFDGRAVTADGSYLAIGYTDGRIELRDLRNGNHRGNWKAHDYNFKALVFSPDGKLLASSGWDRTGKVWDVAQAKLLRTIGGNLLTFESLAFSPDGSRLAAGTAEGTVKLYDVSTAEEVATFTGHRHPVYQVAFGPGGKELISASFDALRVWRAPAFLDLKEVEAHLRTSRSNR